MATIRLLIDEDVRPLLAETLRQRGFDAMHVDELKRSGLSDPEQLTFAVKQRRAILTHNVRHYVLLDHEYRAKGQTHLGTLRSGALSGIIAADDELPQPKVGC
jgi:predicted nuclease of predicted toxin-antitoxin system